MRVTSRADREQHPDEPDFRRLAHDLLQSIAIIQAVTATLQMESDVGTNTRSRLGLIEREMQTMAAMCDRHMALQSAEIALNPAKTAAQVAERIGLTYPGTITVLADAPGAEVVGDEIEWERAVFNLVENACRAAGPRGEVRLEVRAEENSLRIVVGDSGPGFGASPTGRASLGLASVSKLADLHGGHLELRRSSLGGAEVAVVVPLGPRARLQLG
ncbi:MAG: hypothetical protein JWM89_490 [Acidimicrobiales bacterium]|nr:hypothetical protein [Acidimicrobiales bacterium]